jgi:uncharacterized protein (TIGR02466 family)
MNLLHDFSIDNHFPSSCYRTNKPEFLDTIRPAAVKYLERVDTNSLNEVHPVTMSENMSAEQSIAPFIKYIANSAWNILNEQGYNMDMFYTYVSTIWVQNYSKFSSMEYHIHGEGLQLTGLYFVDVPDDCKVATIIHDPRHVKVYANLPRRRDNNLLQADDMVYYNPVPGDLYFTNAWLPHSITKNKSDKPLNVIHINIGVRYNNTYQLPIII